MSNVSPGSQRQAVLITVDRQVQFEHDGLLGETSAHRPEQLLSSVSSLIVRSPPWRVRSGSVPGLGGTRSSLGNRRSARAGKSRADRSPPCHLQRERAAAADGRGVHENRGGCHAGEGHPAPSVELACHDGDDGPVRRGPAGAHQRGRATGVDTDRRDDPSRGERQLSEQLVERDLDAARPLGDVDSPVVDEQGASSSLSGSPLAMQPPIVDCARNVLGSSWCAASRTTDGTSSLSTSSCKRVMAPIRKTASSRRSMPARSRACKSTTSTPPRSDCPAPARIGTRPALSLVPPPMITAP